MSAVAIGEWVQASDSLEFDLACRGAVGVLIRMRRTKGFTEYIVGPAAEGDKTWGAYRHIRRITKAEGREIIKGWREAREERWSRPKPLYDQIWECLIEEAKMQSSAAR